MAKTYPAINAKVEAVFRYIVANTDAQRTLTLKTINRQTASQTTPGWPFKMQENPFSTTTVVNTCKPVYLTPPENKPGLIYRTIDYVDPGYYKGVPPQVASAAHYAATVKLYDDIPQITANLALLYAERKATMESIATALGGIVKCIRDVRKGRVPELLMNSHQLANRKRMSGAWLNYVYGIKPFCQDLYAIAHSDLTPVVYLKGKKTEEYSGVDPYLQKGRIEYDGTYKVAIKAGLSLKDPLIATLAGSGLTNPALIAWELTPFSFMADWVLPIGPYLEMLSSTSGYNKHPGSTTIGQKEICTRVGNYGATATCSRRAVNRSITPFPPAPLPRFKNPYSPIHALNFLTIIHQFVKEKK